MKLCSLTILRRERLLNIFLFFNDAFLDQHTYQIFVTMKSSTTWIKIYKNAVLPGVVMKEDDISIWDTFNKVPKCTNVDSSDIWPETSIMTYIYYTFSSSFNLLGKTEPFGLGRNSSAYKLLLIKQRHRSFVVTPVSFIF